MSPGPLHTHYLLYIPLSYIYFACGSRSPPTWCPWRVHVVSCVHAHVVAPALAVVVVSALRDVTDYRIVKGALFASVGGPCAWLSAALCANQMTASVLLVQYAASLVAVPLSLLVLCGRIIVPPLSTTLSTLASTLVPYCVGVACGSPGPLVASQLCALALLYVECCSSLAHAEGMLYVTDVIVALVLEATHLVTSAATCWVYARCELLAQQHWRLVALCAVPKPHIGAVLGSACDVWGLSSVPAALMLPLRGALLATIADHQL